MYKITTSVKKRTDFFSRVLKKLLIQFITTLIIFIQYFCVNLDLLFVDFFFIIYWFFFFTIYNKTLFYMIVVFSILDEILSFINKSLQTIYIVPLIIN